MEYFASVFILFYFFPFWVVAVNVERWKMLMILAAQYRLVINWLLKKKSAQLKTDVTWCLSIYQRITFFLLWPWSLHKYVLLS